MIQTVVETFFHRRFAVLFFVVTIVIVPSPVSAQFNLQYFLQSAYTNSPQINQYRNSAARAQLEKQLIDAENSAPQLSLSANYLFAPYFNNPGGLLSANPAPDAVGYDVGITNGGLYSAQFNAEKNIFNGPIVTALNNEASARERSALNDIAAARHEIEKQVIDQYLTTLLSLQVYRLEEEAIRYLKEEETITAQLYSRGLIKQTDRLLLEIEIDNRQSDLSNLHAEYKTDLSQLYNLCGITDTGEVAVDTVHLTVAPIADSVHFEKKFELDSIAAVNMQVVSENKYQPQVSLFFNTGLNAVELTGLQRKVGFSAGINFSYPLYDGGQRSITRQQNELSLQTISFYRKSTLLQVENNRAAALSRIDVQRQNLENLHEQMKKYSTVLDISEQELQQGLISVVDYLTMVRNFIELKKKLVTAENNYQSTINDYNYWNW